jgi:hypothetical protein
VAEALEGERRQRRIAFSVSPAIIMNATHELKRYSLMVQDIAPFSVARVHCAPALGSPEGCCLCVVGWLA